jgi:hypothetical protein
MTHARLRPRLRLTERVERGVYAILWNHPVPGILTVQVRGRVLRRLTPKARQCVQELLAQRGMTTLGRSRGAYVWFTAVDEATTGLQGGERQPVARHRQGRQRNTSCSASVSSRSPPSSASCSDPDPLVNRERPTVCEESMTVVPHERALTSYALCRTDASRYHGWFWAGAGCWTHVVRDPLTFDFFTMAALIGLSTCPLPANLWDVVPIEPSDVMTGVRLDRG